jgi:hypothetical protein
MVTSKGAAGVTGSGFIVLASTLTAMNGVIPIEGLALLLGVDRFMSEARAITNFIGNGVATIWIANSEGEFDRKKMDYVFGHVQDSEDILIDNLEILDVIKEMSSSYEKNHNMYMKLCKVVEKQIEKNNKNKLKNDIINAGCIKYIMDIITFYNKNYSDCESETCFYECFYICASNILVLLNSNKKSLYENKIIDANGINVIISAIEHNINNTTIIVSMCMILYNLSKTFSKLVEKIIDANGINVIMHIIKKYDKNIELLQYTNDILGNLANTENNMKKISLAGAIEYVIKTITVQKIKNMNKVIRSGCRTLEKFIVYNNVKSSISIDCINNVIIQNISDPYILVHALPIILSLLNLETQDLIENKI